MDESIKEVLRQWQAQVEASKRRDCVEYADCHMEPEMAGCPKNCGSYNTISAELPELRECTCEIKEGSSERLPLDVAHVTYAHWVVLCTNCGALSHACHDRAEAVRHWNDNDLQRPVNYFGSDG